MKKLRKISATYTVEDMLISLIYKEFLQFTEKKTYLQTEITSQVHLLPHQERKRHKYHVKTRS